MLHRFDMLFCILNMNKCICALWGVLFLTAKMKTSDLSQMQQKGFWFQNCSTLGYEYCLSHSPPAPPLSCRALSLSLLLTLSFLLELHSYTPTFLSPASYTFLYPLKIFPPSHPTTSLKRHIHTPYPSKTIPHPPHIYQALSPLLIVLILCFLPVYLLFNFLKALTCGFDY